MSWWRLTLTHFLKEVSILGHPGGRRLCRREQNRGRQKITEVKLGNSIGSCRGSFSFEMRLREVIFTQ